MKRNRIMPTISSIIMMLALLWLTVSTPFIYSSEQSLVTTSSAVVEDSDNPLSNSNEEKTESSANSFSEYLHDHDNFNLIAFLSTLLYKTDPSALYLAFHPQLQSPPPECLS